MKNGEIMESVFRYVLEKYLLKVVEERCTQKYIRKPGNYATVPCTSVPRLKCPSCRKQVMAAKFTQHLSRCIKLNP
ncbi:hypothetical protein P7C65_03s4g04280 [Encephalitozoon intestinalis]